MAQIIEAALPYWFACNDYRRTLSSFVKVRAESDLWSLASCSNPIVQAASKRALIDLKLVQIHPVEPPGAA